MRASPHHNNSTRSGTLAYHFEAEGSWKQGRAVCMRVCLCMCVCVLSRMMDTSPPETGVGGARLREKERGRE